MLVRNTLKCIKRKFQQKYLFYCQDRKFIGRGEWDNITPLIAECEESVIFFTHDNGGGTRAFEHMYLQEGTPTMIVRRVGHAFMPDRYFQLEFYNHKNINEFILITRQELFELFKFNYKEIIVNSLVNFRCYKEILEAIVNYKETHSKSCIKYLVHDFHAVCPNMNLFVEHDYCNLECNDMKCKLELGDKTISINEWRGNWSGFLERIDEIKCFSNSTKEIVHEAFPNVCEAVFSVQPHDMGYCTYMPIKGVEKLSLNIGICGRVSTDYKGKTVVSNIIRRYGNEIPITVVGTSARQFNIVRRKVKYLGPYKREQLRDIIVREKISVVLFPSQCPETFSYLVSELIEMDIPIICFNIGAQAEKVNKYHRGWVCNDMDEVCDLIDKMHANSLD